MNLNLKPLFLFAMLILVFCSVMNGCDWQPDSDQRENAAVEDQQNTYVRNQPPPHFDWSFERHLMTKLYEARNRAVTTTSYAVSSYTGKIIFQCPSIGFPIPATTQLTNPQRIVRYGGAAVSAIAQAEPNGLYAPPQTDATWIMCVGPDGNVEPVYMEEHVIASPRALVMDGDRLTPDLHGRTSLSIDPHRR